MIVFLLFIPCVYGIEEERVEADSNPRTGNYYIYVVFGVMFFSCAFLISCDYFNVSRKVDKDE